MAKLYFKYGAMGSSKTANAIMVQYNYQERGQKALMLKPRLDNRDGARLVGSRAGLQAPCFYVEELDSLDLSQYDCVIVDEAQFLKKEQVRRTCSFYVIVFLKRAQSCFALLAKKQRPAAPGPMCVPTAGPTWHTVLPFRPRLPVRYCCTGSNRFF